MTVQLNANIPIIMLTTIRSAFPSGNGAVRIRTGAPPVNCAASDTGTVLAVFSEVGNLFAEVVGNQLLKSSTWSVAAIAAGDAGHFRLYDETTGECHIQGTITVTGGGGDMTVDDLSVEVGQAFYVTGFRLVEGNA